MLWPGQLDVDNEVDEQAGAWPSTYGNVPEMVRELRDEGLIADGNRHLEPSADVHFSLRLDEY